MKSCPLHYYILFTAHVALPHLPPQQEGLQHLRPPPLQLPPLPIRPQHVCQTRTTYAIQAALKWKIHYSSAKIIAREARRDGLMDMFHDKQTVAISCGWKEVGGNK